MALPFPLYEELEKLVASQPPKVDWRRLGMTINQIPGEHPEILMALIRHHYLLENPKAQTDLPYRGRLLDGRRGVIYNAQDIPPKLEAILSKYVELVTDS